MDQKNWPAVTFQGFFIALNVGLIAATEGGVPWFFWSLFVLMVLTVIQMTSDNYRWLYLYPVDTSVFPPIKMVYWDTYLLRLLLGAGAFLFVRGAVDNWNFVVGNWEVGDWEISIGVSLAGVLIGLVWDKWLDKKLREHAVKKVNAALADGAFRVVPTIPLTADQILELAGTRVQTKNSPPADE